MATYIVAVSGGVDSIALLDMLARTKSYEIIVAHFDHGIRGDSADDASFVESLAAKYGMRYEKKREALGPDASEETARNRRYAFLRRVAQKYNGRIVTAHHADDIVETIAINFRRGTGWRGLAVLDSDVLRPLIHVHKADLIAYAKQHNLTWREDSTNGSDTYLRNRVRRQTQALDPTVKKELLALRAQQVASKKMIEEHIVQLVGEGPWYSRYFFIHIPSQVALECLRYITKATLTRPQIERSLLAIKTARPKSSYQAGSGTTFDFTTRNFSLSLLK
ncbi:MAG: tRNA lysidine(34) synthetase TilS [Candidatus Microsaccharimonas sossegonensis]|uniref:tRNA(Ile)-lysidine synthase n=1 Tax=Candidatus Microsaccharimonas sossegonensis TaxID=2506948 RepID=A0A4Q0AGQ1_9BACT|nr:MAG: tRNA lysidine(34) synthetase TilS [Candidatus Microsaccharimonas sossegonensis]